jgi:peptide methionine sulfoxide reductase msrA/msrB
MRKFLNKKAFLGSLLIIVILIFMTDTKNTNDFNEELSMYEKAYFAGGCFWCVESDFEKLEGVKEVYSGYMGGEQDNPTYKNHGDHRESVEVIYDASVVSYKNLVEYFFRHHDPTDPDGSFYDRGHSYTSAIYPQNNQEEESAWLVIKDLEDKKVFDKSIVTAVERDATFWIAEDYHQDYHQKNPVRYKGFRFASGRDKFIKKVWGERDDFEIKLEGTTNKWSDFVKPTDEELRASLSEISYKVTQKDGTERPRSEGNLDKNYDPGIYVDIVSGEPLFSSDDKFDSGTGWPSFTKPISAEFVVTKTDRKLIIARTEVRSRYADSHLGHVFKDGPEPTGQRWCMNGAAMRFIPLEEMGSEGYEDYTKYVQKTEA